MTSLRTFQNEIDEIQHREIVKQRAVAHATQEKENKKAPAVPTSPTVTTTSEVPALVDIPSISEDMSANDEEIQVWRSSICNDSRTFLVIVRPYYFPEPRRTTIKRGTL